MYGKPAPLPSQSLLLRESRRMLSMQRFCSIGLLPFRTLPALKLLLDQGDDHDDGHGDGQDLEDDGLKVRAEQVGMGGRQEKSQIVEHVDRSPLLAKPGAQQCCQRGDGQEVPGNAPPQRRNSIQEFKIGTKTFRLPKLNATARGCSVIRTNDVTDRAWCVWTKGRPK